MLKGMQTPTLAILVARALLSPREFSCNPLGSRASYPCHSQRNICPHPSGFVSFLMPPLSSFLCSSAWPLWPRPPTFFSSLQLALLLLTVGKFDNLVFLIAFLNHLIKPELLSGLGSWVGQRLYSLCVKGGEKHKGWNNAILIIACPIVWL